MHSLSSSIRASAIAVAVAGAFTAAAAHAEMDGGTQLENIVVTGARPGAATYEAPTQGNLDAGEPQSIINQHYIESNLGPAANYTDIINIAPSVADTTPNGRGNAESLNLSIRGFQDGQFNVTFDGIPWNDSNDFTHHSTSYFTANTIGSVTVDRGPGTAAQIGNATFGGTVALRSKDPTEASNFSPALTLGTWRTNDLSVEVDTGTLAEAGNGRALLTLTDLNTDGAMSNNGQQRKNAFFKFTLPVGSDTSLTAVAMYNTIHQNVSQFGTTAALLAQNGPHYSLSDVASSDSYYGFNFDDIHTDFEYLQFKSSFGGLRVDDKVYTYGYYHKINETNDPSLSGGSLGQYDAANGIGLPSGGIYGVNDVGGQKGFNDYRSWGNILRLEADAGPGVVRGGLWIDYQWNDRVLYNVDWTLGGILDPYGQAYTDNGVTFSSPYQRYLHDDLTTIDPFIEYEFHPVDALTVTPGLRYSSFKRKIDAAVNPVTGLQSDSSGTWNGAQPSLYANYKVVPNASVYAQYARGFLAPKDKLAYQPNQTAASDIAAQHTTNLQAGGSWKSNDLTVAADVYHIKFDNFETYAAKGAGVVPVGGGSAIFKGLELEATYAVGAGVNLYGNYSHNAQSYADGTPVQYAPDGTYAAGVIYDAHGLYGSLMAKHVGSTWQAGNGTMGKVGGVGGYNGAYGAYQVNGFTTADLALGYAFNRPFTGVKDAKLRLLVSDLSNNQTAYYVYNAAMSGADEFMTLPGRSYTLTVSADF
jgi:iron complex outermembrane receptor protein